MGIGEDAAPPTEHGGDAPAAPADGRMAVVGLEALDADEPPEAGSFLFFEDDLVQGLGRGRVTTVLHGLRPGRTVALGLLQGGWAHRGRALVAASPVQGREYRLRVTELSMPPPALLLPGPPSEAGPGPKRVIPPEPPDPGPTGQGAPGPFADLQDAERPSASGRVGVRLVAVGPLPAWRIATWPSGAAALESVVGEMASGHPPHAVPPGQSGRPIPSVHGRPVRCGPDAFLLWHSPPITGGRMSLAGDPAVATLTDLGHAYASLCVSGPDSRALLARFWSLDLRDGAFTVGAARCLPGDAACGRSADCVLLRTGAQDYELRIPTSLALYWLDALVDAAREFGVSVVVPGAGQPPASTSTRQS